MVELILALSSETTAKPPGTGHGCIPLNVFLPDMIAASRSGPRWRNGACPSVGGGSAASVNVFLSTRPVLGTPPRLPALMNRSFERKVLSWMWIEYYLLARMFIRS
jgi:hypothetical protein